VGRKIKLAAGAVSLLKYQLAVAYLSFEFAREVWTDS